MSIKLIVTDMDGTLLDDDHATVPRRNIDALRAASKRGVKLALASGRTWSLLLGAQEQLGCLDYALLANGAAVWDVAVGKSIYDNTIPNDLALAITEVLQREGLAFEVYCDGQGYVRASDREKILDDCLSPAFARYFDAHTIYPETIAQALAGRSVEKFDVLYVPDEKRQLVQAEVEALGPVSLTQALRYNMEFNAVGVNKGVGVQALAEHLGLGADEVMAFGDAANDLELLSWAGWSFAMENGTEEAKAAAKYPAGRNSDAGVAQAVEKYVLGK